MFKDTEELRNDNIMHKPTHPESFYEHEEAKQRMENSAREWDWN